MNTYLVSEFVKDTAVSLEKSYRQLPPFDCEKSTVAVDFGGLYETHHDDALRDAELSEFACRYQAAYPDDKVFADHVADFGVNRDDPAESWGLQAVNVFNDRWQWDYRAAAGEYLRHLLEFVNGEFDLALKLRDINWTRDNFAVPDLAVLEPLGAANMLRLREWLAVNPDAVDTIKARIEHAATARDGYIPFYSYNQLTRDDGWLARFTVEHLINCCCDWDSYTSKCCWFEDFAANHGSELTNDYGEFV